MEPILDWPSIWDWGNAVIVSIQTIHNPVLGAIFSALTFLGEPEFFLFFFPILIWNINKSLGQRSVYLLFSGLTINTWAKELFDHPRPFEWPTRETSPVLKLNDIEGAGLPSGHTQTSLMLWFYLAYHIKKRWLWIVATILFVLVSFSRVYLGVHFPTDLLGGAILGLIVLLLFIYKEDALAEMLSRASAWLLASVTLIISITLIVIYPHPDAVAAISALCGFSLGIIFDRQKFDFETAGTIKQYIVRYVVGLFFLVIIYAGIKLLQSSPDQWLYVPIRVLRYSIAGFWVSGGAPWLFTKLKLAGSRLEGLS